MTADPVRPQEAEVVSGMRLFERVRKDAVLLAQMAVGEDNPISVVYWFEGRPSWEHTCRGRRIVYAGLDNVRWSWDEAANSVTPSLHCIGCGTHGLWTNGVWRGV